MSAQPKIAVKTRLPTTPFPLNTERKPIRTERLIIRPFSEDDLDGIHSLRTQPEVMKYTAVGRIDANKEETGVFMARFMPPNDVQTYNNIITLASTGELIGVGGGTSRPESVFGWPEIGYLFKKEYWGQGYATEFLKAWLNDWWTLPRSEIETQVDGQSVNGVGEVPEMITAFIEESNTGSRRVLEKAGFREFKQWSEPDSRDGYGRQVTLVGFVLSSPDSKS
ncbi:acyl-CoA N-acyltransferase [Annulohypoxylon maeteangense]|uniref:acyl-CoA N-acyltransferase n=1 Tax=Annulohypoxylon maeteangense TaxID=1927788 RepID=UPI0020087E86|nr:acyl-CoA N-acyltransferase [Annulohypoxylon maeteangense]KAI0882320.1 acyl-CoA N-acyltransferase [Annulohypoxylon maeteangense]